MSSGLAIRQVRAEEGPAFRAIRLAALGDSPTAFGSTLGELLNHPKEYWESRVQRAAEGIDQVLFVAEDQGQWIGIVGGFVDDAGTTRSVDLISMWINPSHRGQGLARRLVARLVAWARERGAGRVVLWVTEDNDIAARLYRRCGFQPSGKTEPLPSHPYLREREMVLDLT